MSNMSGDGGGSFSSGNTGEEVQQQQPQSGNHFHGSNAEPSPVTNSNGSSSQKQVAVVKKKRNLPGTPDPDAEVIALSPTTLMARNRFVCEICNKGFQRDQNLQLHRRGHNLPWKLRQRSSTDIRKRVYICPEPTCVHHNPSRALGDLTGIKKHFSRKHGEKKWKCDKCSKKYAVQSDWKAHSKTCGTREYKCDCGTIFSRRDSFITHRAFCDALAEENNKVNQGLVTTIGGNMQDLGSDIMSIMPMNNQSGSMSEFDLKNPMKALPHDQLMSMPLRPLNMGQGMLSCSSTTLFGGPRSVPSASSCLQLSSNSSSNFTGLHDQQLIASANMSATALLQKAAQMGATASNNVTSSPMMQKNFASSMVGPDQFSGVRPLPFGGLQQHNNLYHNIQPQTDQLQLVPVDGDFNRQFLSRGRQEMAQHCFETPIGPGNSPVNDVGMYSGLYTNGNQDHGFLKNVEHENGVTTGTLQGRTVNSSLDIPTSGQDMMTVDFLGMGGSRPTSLHDQHQQHNHQHELEFEAISQPKLQGADPFQQQLSYGHGIMEKPMWDT